MANYPLTEKEKEAWDFAKDAHKNQIRKFTNKPYFDAHVAPVNGVVKLYTTDENLLITALLHDTIEDCFKYFWKGYSVIKEMFGQQIADLVAELTSSKDEIKHKYDGSKTNYLIYKMSNMSDDALLVKLADRFKNIEDAFTASEKFRNKYYIETKEIIEELEKARHLDGIHRLLANDIKAKLDNISSMFNI